MPRNSAGIYTLPPGYEAVTGQTIEASQHNPPLEDIASALTGSLPRNGTAGMGAPLAMGGFRVSGLGTGTEAADAITKAQLDAVVAAFTALVVTIPAGTFAMYAGSVVPTGWLECNGIALSRTTFAALFAAISTRYGAGDGSTTFNLPDMRGEFPRVWDNGRGVDPGRALGTGQSFLVQTHTHSINDPSHSHVYLGSSDITTNIAVGGASAAAYISGSLLSGSAVTGITVNAAGGAETRPRNVSLIGMIKT
jgi:microcystin-dependent protein